eukprot:EST47580.1 5' nucleotidase family protein [Spironucleus salmonicida]
MMLALMSLRIIHSSDTHGWLWGDPHQPSINAGFSGILAFIRHQRTINPQTFVFDSGDFIMGNGLSDADNDVPTGQFVYKMWEKALKGGHYYDTITLGNHDFMLADSLKYVLYESDIVFNSTTTNSWFQNEKHSPGQRWRRVKNGNLTTLVAGFMYPFKSKDPIIIRDLKLIFDEDQFFQSLLKNEKPDFITILVHSGYHQHPETAYYMYQSIREYTDCPVIILGGHEHQTVYDYEISTSKINAKLSKFNKEVNTNWKNIFTQNFDKNFVYAETVNYFRNISLIDIDFEDYTTPTGSKIIKSIKFVEQLTNQAEFISIQNITTDQFLNQFEKDLNTTIFDEVKRLDLLKVVGNAPMEYKMLNPNYINDSSSIWNLWFTEMVPKVLYKSDKLNNKPVHFLGTSFFPSDIVKGEIFKNDFYLTIPYKEEWFFVFRNVKAIDLKRCYKEINGRGGMEGFSKYFDFPVISALDDNELLDVICSDYDSNKLIQKFKEHDMTYTYDSFGSLTPFDIYQEFVTQFWQ